MTLYKKNPYQNEFVCMDAPAIGGLDGHVCECAVLETKLHGFDEVVFTPHHPFFR